ncbi:hypothetical protein T459_28822 [Capsicum annuum]|uniref:FF domain-containing protein n=1 Tax=Capsicum annuum TaxID=4072 RepID=A0A2G2YHY1_CAPAN|nr:hypothetical protein FXO37_19790 [Capsicum annuum]PHT69335.1 hypothetical protein T459_28822 [Capsicum annuum]
MLHKSSPIVVSPAANLPTIVASESSSLSGKVSSSMIETVEIKISSEPASPAIANSKKIRIAVTLGNSIAPSVSETTTTQDAVVYGDGFSSENREVLCPSEILMRLVNYYWLLVKTPRKLFVAIMLDVDPTICSAVISQLLTGEEYAPNSNEEHGKALEEQKRNRVEYLEFLKSCDFIKEYIRDLESENEEQRKLQMEELRKAERKNRDKFQKLMEEHVFVGILNAKTYWHDYCIKIKDFAAYLAVSSDTSRSTAKDLFTDVMDELEKPVK